MTAETPAIKALEDARKDAQAELERVKASTADAIREGERASRLLRTAQEEVQSYDQALIALRDAHKASLRGGEVES